MKVDQVVPDDENRSKQFNVVLHHTNIVVIKLKHFVEA